MYIKLPKANEFDEFDNVETAEDKARIASIKIPTLDELDEFGNVETQEDKERIASIKMPRLNDWSFGSALQNATHDYIAGLGNSRQRDINEFRALGAMSDEEYKSALKSGRVKDRLDRIMTSRLSQEDRQKYYEDVVNKATALENATNAVADWLVPAPDPYISPEGFLQKTGDVIANAIPSFGVQGAGYSLLGGLPMAALNTISGVEQAKDNIYANKISTGATHEEALSAADNTLANLVQATTQGATNLATMYFLGKAPTYNPLGASPYRQVLGNALGAVGSSMAGTAADEMIQNYRSDKENDYGKIAKNAGTAGLVTGGIAAFNAARNLGRINRLQDLYNKNRVYDIEGREIIPLGIEGGNEASSQGTDTPSTPNTPNTPSGLLPAETATTATRRINFNDTLARYGINGGANGSEAINNLAVAYTSRIISDNDLTNIANELQPSNPSAFENLIRERATTVEPLVKVEKPDIRSLLTPEVEHWTAENQNIKKPGVDIARGADFNRLLSPVNVTKPNLSGLMPQTEKIPLDTDFLQPTRQPITPVAEETKIDVTPLQPQQVQPTAEKQPKTQNGNVWEDPLKTRRTTTPVNDNQLPPYVSETIELMREAIRDVTEDDFRDYFLPKLYPNLPQTEIAKITKDDVIKDLYLQSKKTQSKGNLEIPAQQAQPAQNPTMGTVKNNAITPLGIQSEQPQQTPTSDENKVPEQPDYKNGTPEEWNEYYRKLYAYKLKEREKAELEARKKGKTFIPNVEDEKLLKNLERVVGEVEQQEQKAPVKIGKSTTNQSVASLDDRKRDNKNGAFSETPYKDRGENSDDSDKGSELWEKANKFNQQIGENNTRIQKIKEEIRGKLNINREYNLQELAQFPKEKAEIERLENENKTLEEQFEKYSRLSAIEKEYPKLGKFRVNEVKNGKKFLTFYISKSKKNQDLSIHEIGKGTNTSLKTGIYSAESNILYLSQDYFEPRHSLVAFALGMADEEHISRDAEFGERVRDEFEKVLRKNHIYASPKIVKGLKNYRSGEEIHKQSVPSEAEKEQPKLNITEELLKKWGLEKHRGELIDNTTTQENKENNISKGQKQVTDKTNSTNSASEKVLASQQIAKTVSDFILRNYPTGENFTFSEEAVGNLDKLSNRDLFDIADSTFKGTQGQGKYTPKDAYDAMEMGINQAIIKLGIKADDKNNRKDLAKLSMMLKSLPTQANRTETQIEFQQFSTPPTLSYIASWLANIKDGETVLEPSAGLGGLVIYAKNAGAKIILNELEPRRAELLESMNLGKVYRENGEHIGDILATKISDSERPDKVIMNPPFSSTAGRIKGQRNSNNAIIHVQQALEILKDGGRLVAILGKGTTSKPAWKDIEAEYNVRAEINLDGSNYRKYGTSFDNMIVVIDKTGATPSGSTVKKDFKNLESIFEVQELKNIRNNVTSTEKKEIKREEELPHPTPMSPDLLKQVPEKGVFTMTMGTYLEPTPHKEQIIFEKERYQNNEWWVIFRTRGGRSFASLAYEGTYVRSSGAIRRKGQRYYITDKEFLDLKEAFESYIEELSQEKLNEKLPVLESKQEDKHESKTEAPIKNKQEENSKKHSPEDKVLATEDGIEDPSLEEELVKKFKRAFDKLDNGRIYVKIPDLREALGWEHDMFDNVVKYLRDNGIATPHTGDASVDPRTKDYFYDENNIRFGTLSWNENNKNLKEATVTTPERTTNKPPVSNDTSEPISKRQQQPQTKSNKKEKKRTISEMAEVKGYKIKTKSKEDHVKERKADAKIEKKYYDIQDKENTDTPETQEISINSNYHPSISTGVEHPADLVESSAMASVSLPPLTYTPMLPAETIEEGKISSAQLEIVAYAGQAFSHELPDGRVQGFFIGDGTGVGKGREIAAIIQDCLAHGYGKGKAVWVSVKTTDLFKEAKEHWEAIGNDPDELFTQSDEKICPAKGDIKRDKDVLFTSYSLLNTAGRAPQLERWLGEDYDGIIVLDECHTANNATEQKGTRGMIAPSKISQIILSLVNKYPKAKILYSSATGATEVRNFALYDRLGLWGKDAPFDTKADFQEAINNGGLAGMEKLIMDLKAMGLYVSRSISYRAGPHGGDDDVTFSILEANITQEQRDTYNRIAEAWRVVERNLHKALQTCGVGEKGKGVELTTKPKEGDKTGANPYSLYRSLHQRVFNQIITSYKTDALIKDAKKQLANGKSVIIQLTTTNEAELKRAIERRMNERGIKSLKDIKGDSSFYDSLDYSPKFALTDFVLASFPIYQVEEYEEELSTGEKIKKIRQVQDSDGNPVVNQKALRIRDELLNDIGDFNYPQSPIDKIIDAFGVDNVAELTGRSERVITIDGKKQKQNITQTSKENDKELFLNGTIDKATGERVWKRILIFSKGGATGASYHAGRNFYNQQQRIHYILEAGWSASTAVQGMGRSHRTNQACKPHFVLVSSGIPGEKRFVSSIARRILQLGALTSGERKNASKGIFTEEDNLESKQARRAMDRVFGTLNKTSRGKQLIADMGLTEANSKNDEINIMTVFNRILALDIEDQESIFSIFGDYLKQEIYKAKEVGELDTRTENVKAESIKVLENQVIWESEKYNADTRYIKLELQKKNKPRKWKELITGEKYFSLPNGDIGKRTYDRTNELEFYTNEDGQIFAVETTGDTQRIPSGEREGEEVPKVVVYSVEKKKRLTSNMAYFQNRWPRQQHKYTKVPNKEAKEIWEKQIKSMSPTYPEILHMITGLELPIWNKFSGVAPHLIRVTTDDGEIYLGRGVSDSRIGFLLDRFNIGKLKGNNKFTPETIRKYLSSGRKVIELSNGFTLQYSRVNGEMRLEIKGNVMSSTRERWGKDYGAIIEYINNKPRIFVPAEDDRLLKYILSQYNIVKESEKKWEEYEDNAISEINSGIPDGEVLNFLPKLFRFKSERARDPENNPLLKTASPYSFVDEEVEERYLENKKARKLPGILQHIRDFGAKVWENRVDLPGLVGKEKFAKAVNILRELNLERRATVQEVVTAFRQILKDLTPDDFDLFERAMLVEDLAETIRLDEKAELPQGWTDESFLSDYENIKREVQKNKEVREAINKAEAYGEKLREDIIRESENLGFYTLRNKLRRKHYFRHLVMEYYEMANGGIKRPIVENIMNRGHYRKRKGSTMDINTDWIIAMGEVYTRMADDIKIMKALSKLREEYDVIDITKEHAISMNMELALADIKETLKNIPPDEINQKAIETLNSEINGVRSKAISRIFELAQKGDLPVGINNREWERLVERLAEAGQLENLTKKEINDFSRYIGWLVSNREGIFNQKGEVTAEPKKEAVRIIKGEAIRRKKLFEMLKERYITWQSLVPPNYEVFFPTHTGMIFSALSIPENLTQVAMRELEGELDIPISDIANMMSAGGLMQAWAIPSELAKTLKDFGAKQPLGSFGKVMKGLMSKFKKLTLLGPFNGRFAKYNIRNLLGDFEAVLQGNPGALLYVPQAIKELHKYIIEGAVPTGDLAEFVKRGGAITTEFSTALENWGDLTEFQNLIDKKKGTKISLWELPQKFILKPYMYYASLLTNFRESILRYAAFLSYKKLIDDNGGLPPFYGMSKKIEVDALKGNTYAMAFKLANENLGAYDEVSKDMQYLLDNNWVSFGAWLETCFTRTMQMYMNIITGSNYLEYYENKLIGKLITVLAGAGGGGKEPPNTSGISGLGFFDDDTPFFRNLIKNVKGIKNFSPKKAAVLIQRYINQLVLSFPLLIGALIINWLNSEDDKQLPPTVGTHLTLGRNPITNEIVYISDIGSMGQFFGLFPQIILLTGVKDLLDGKQTMRGLLSDTLSSPVNEILSNLNPLLKILTDTLYGKKMYPDFRNGSPIRNIPRYTAQTFNLGWWYDLLAGEPHSHFLNIASSLFNTAKADGSSSYHYIIGRKREFQEKFLGKSSGGFSSSTTGEQLRKARASLRYDDFEKTKESLRAYFQAGGTRQGLKQSISMLAPLSGLNDAQKKQFVKWLSEEDKEHLKRAMQYYKNVISKYMMPRS